MGTTAIRPVKDDELAAVAQLRWLWCMEGQGTPTLTHKEFIRDFAAWARNHRSSHRCLILVEDNTLIGMVWLAITPRVPSALSQHRASGDIQSMYVLPERRNAGLGGRLIDAAVELADHLGLQGVTVQSSKDAVNAYIRHGFAPSPGLLHTVVTR
jgi:GNAT superfamily N-acetyltransferase